MLPDLHTDFSRGRSGGLVFPSLSEFSTVYYDPHSLFNPANGHVKKCSTLLIFRKCKSKIQCDFTLVRMAIIKKSTNNWDFPGGPVVKTPCCQCRGCGFDPWLGNKDPACCAAKRLTNSFKYDFIIVKTMATNYMKPKWKSMIVNPQHIMLSSYSII